MTQDLIRERQAMLAGMTPTLKAGSYHFCTTDAATVPASLLSRSLAMFREDEGIALILSSEDARAHGFDRSMPMARIVLEVYSALDGVGLTAGVAGALADAGIPCNMVAAYHHDHVFVPEAMAQRAVEILLAVQRDAMSSPD